MNQVENQIHPTCIIDDRVELGKGNKILPYTIIYGPTKIGDGNIIGPNVVIGTPGQDTKNKYYDSSECLIEIGDNNIIREFTAIQKPAYKEVTKLGSNIFLMQSVHIPHDVIIEDEVTITPMSVLAGLTYLCKGCNIGIGGSVHQYSVIGHYSMVAMGAAVTKNIPPFSIYVPGKKLRINHYSIDKFSFNSAKDEIEKFYKEGTVPKNGEVGSIFDSFFKLHKDSKRKLYQ